MDIKNIFGHEVGYADIALSLRPWHIPMNKSSISTAYCNNKDICCCELIFTFNQICKKCWKILSKKEQEELVHYFCVKRLKE